MKPQQQEGPMEAQRAMRSMAILADVEDGRQVESVEFGGRGVVRGLTGPADQYRSVEQEDGRVLPWHRRTLVLVEGRAPVNPPQVERAPLEPEDMSRTEVRDYLLALAVRAVHEEALTEEDHQVLMLAAYYVEEPQEECVSCHERKPDVRDRTGEQSDLCDACAAEEVDRPKKPRKPPQRRAQG